MNTQTCSPCSVSLLGPPSHIRQQYQLICAIRLADVGYVICMLPANIIQRKISPHFIVGTSCLLFGLFVACMAAAHSYGAMLGLRILVGFSQAFIQGMTVYLSLWFRRDEIAGVAGTGPPFHLFTFSPPSLEQSG